MEDAYEVRIAQYIHAYVDNINNFINIVNIYALLRICVF